MSKLLTEIADYDTPGSWGPASEGWPGFKGDHAYNMYVFANMTEVIPYGSYVLISQKGEYKATESYLRVHVDYIKQLAYDFLAAGLPSAAESVKRRGQAGKAARWWV